MAKIEVMVICNARMNIYDCVRYKLFQSVLLKIIFQTRNDIEGRKDIKQSVYYKYNFGVF